MTLPTNKMIGICDICGEAKKTVVELTDEQECRNYHCSAIADICISICQDCLEKIAKIFE